MGEEDEEEDNGIDGSVSGEEEGREDVSDEGEEKKVVKKMKADAVQFKNKPPILSEHVSNFVRRTSKSGSVDEEYDLYTECSQNLIPGFTPAVGQAVLTKQQFKDLPPHSVS